MSRNQKKMAARVAKGGLLFLSCLFFIAPYLWMVLISLKPRVDIFEPGKWLFLPTLENYRAIIKDAGIGDYFLNSVIIAAVSTLFSLIVGSFAAYGFARFNWKSRENTAFMVLSQMMLQDMDDEIHNLLMAKDARQLDKIQI